MTASSANPEVDHSGLLRIGELAEQAGVARGTIQHYLREGLLPKPVKTTRNMAYYDPACVERIRVIKELQAKSYLPLSEIRELLGDGSTESSFAQAIIHAQEAALKAITPAARNSVLSLSDAAQQFGLRPQLLEQLAERGLVTVHKTDEGAEVVRGIDIEVLAAISKLKQVGFTERAGFQADDLVIYQQALQELLENEVRTFMRVLSKDKDTITPKLARAAVEGATMLLVALRKKSIVDLLGAAPTPPERGDDSEKEP